jgi:anti-sigma regulatory factor (Ser/Thr protein kinase)
MPGDRVFELELPRDVLAPRVAREHIAQWFASTLDVTVRETATLLSSELVTNAVRHGEGAIQLKADLNDVRLLVEVIDEGGGLERALREHNLENVEGYGLRLVHRESSRWGAREGTTHVWFELQL